MDLPKISESGVFQLRAQSISVTVTSPVACGPPAALVPGNAEPLADLRPAESESAFEQNLQVTCVHVLAVGLHPHLLLSEQTVFGYPPVREATKTVRPGPLS